MVPTLSQIFYKAIDTDKFGYKMLMKMGWEDGKGLGKNEDGNTDNLNIAFKADTIGKIPRASFPSYRTWCYKKEPSYRDLLSTISI